MKSIGLTAIAALLIGISVASAQTSPVLTWNLGGSGGSGYSGNVRSFDAGGVNLKASAWSDTKGSSNSSLEKAKLGQWSPGLGVINRYEDGSSPYHQADNDQHNDWILFVFDELVDIQSVRIQPSPGPFDRDVSYWVGTVTPGVNLTGVTYSGLAALGFGGEQTVAHSRGSSALNVAIQTPTAGVNALLFGPKRGVCLDPNDVDAFKVQSITAVAVPELSATILSALGFVSLLRRRR